MRKLFTLFLMLGFIAPVMAKSGSNKPQTYSAARAGKSLQNQQAQQALGNTYDQKCYYCYKDLSTEYNPSARKYGKTQQ